MAEVDRLCCWPMHVHATSTVGGSGGGMMVMLVVVVMVVGVLDGRPGCKGSVVVVVVVMMTWSSRRSCHYRQRLLWK